MLNGNAPVAVKELDDPAVRLAIERSVRRSVIVPERRATVPGAIGGDISASGIDTASVFFVASQADGMQQWGVNPTFRDRQLRLFFPTESVLNSAITSMVARNAGFEWRLAGPDLLTDATFDLLHSANRGAGWTDWVSKISLDLYTQDKGAFSEIIRTADSPDAPTIGIQSLDAARCFHTGDPAVPVIYVDRLGKFHQLKWYQVMTFAEMPAPHERLYGLQYCAMTRILKAAQIFRNIQIYRDEKTGGRHARAIHIIGGVEANQLEDALKEAQNVDDAAGRERFSKAPIVVALNPTVDPKVATLELATLPDAFDAEQAFKEYLTIVALGLFVDFQEIAPLPGGGLGSGSQSEILHLKTRGKGPALWMKLIEQKLNFHGVIPRPVTFEFNETDPEQESTQAETSKTRAEARKLQVESGEIDAAGARQLALDAGDISQELADEMDHRDLTENPRRSDQHRDEGGEEPGSSDERVEEGGEKARDPDRAGPEDERLELEADLAVPVGRGLRRLQRDVERRLAEEVI